MREHDARDKQRACRSYCELLRGEGLEVIHVTSLMTEA